MSVEDAALRAAENLMERPAGPLGFRFLVQPMMASIIAVRHGIKDAKTGKPPYILAILLPSEIRGAALREGIRSTTRVMVFALLLDMVYQIYIFDAFYIGEAAVIAFALGFLPYTIMRGPVAWMARRSGGEEQEP